MYDTALSTEKIINNIPHSVFSSLATVPGGHSLQGAKPPLSAFIVFLLHLSEKSYLEKAVLERCTDGVSKIDYDYGAYKVQALLFISLFV